MKIRVSKNLDAAYNLWGNQVSTLSYGLQEDRSWDPDAKPWMFDPQDLARATKTGTRLSMSYLYHVLRTYET